MSLDLTKQRLLSAESRIDVFIDQNIFDWAIEEVLLPGQYDLTNSINSRASEALSIEKVGFMKVDLKWDFRGKDGEPLHFFIEYGTAPHRIIAKGKLFGGSDVLHWVSSTGKNMFAKSVNHPGTPPRNLIHHIAEERTPQLRQRIIAETQNKMELERLR